MPQIIQQRGIKVLLGGILAVVGILCLLELWQVYQNALAIEIEIPVQENYISQLIQTLFLGWLQPLLNIIAQVSMVASYAAFLLPIGVFFVIIAILFMIDAAVPGGSNALFITRIVMYVLLGFGLVIAASVIGAI